MALEKDLEIKKYGLNLKKAYIKIRGISGNKNQWILNVETYVNKEIATECEITNRGYLEVVSIRVPGNLIDLEKNLYKQFYNYLKTLDQFKDCIDN